MNPSFTELEKRFVLAEMIKSSCVDIDALAHFISSNIVEPDWGSMQVPHGRNLNQCMQVAEQLGIQPTSSKRKLSSEWYEPPYKKRATSDHMDQRRPSSSSSAVQPTTNPTPSHVPILPRPARGYSEGSPAQPAPPPQPRKRGRPSRADKAKRDLRPILPHQLAPRQPEMPQPIHSTTPTPAQPLLPPAVTSPQTQMQASPPSAAYNPMPMIEESGPRTKPERPSSADEAAARPRIMAEGPWTELEPITSMSSFPRHPPPMQGRIEGPVSNEILPRLPSALRSLPPLRLIKMEPPMARAHPYSATDSSSFSNPPEVTLRNSA